jgi:putative endonuclease
MAKTDGAAPPGKVASPARVAAFRTGLSAEARAAAYLMAKGYRILAKRFRTPHGEIDIVARRRNLVAFIEVKARASLDEAAYAVTPRQQARIIAAAAGAHHRRGPGLADGASRACRIRAAFRRHADCAEAPAAPSVSGVRRQHLISTSKSPASGSRP